MSQNYTDTQPGTVAADLASLFGDGSLRALLTLHAGATEPATTQARMLWHDTTTNTLKVRNAADTAWITLLPDTTAGNYTTTSQVDARERQIALPVGDISATKNFYLLGGSAAVTVLDALIISETATTSDGSNKWTVQVQNLTTTNNLRSAAYDTNADADFAADTPLALGLDQNLGVALNDVLQIQFTKTGSPGTITNALIILRYTVAT